MPTKTSHDGQWTYDCPCSVSHVLSYITKHLAVAPQWGSKYQVNKKGQHHELQQLPSQWPRPIAAGMLMGSNFEKSGSFRLRARTYGGSAQWLIVNMKIFEIWIKKRIPVQTLDVLESKRHCNLLLLQLMSLHCSWIVPALKIWPRQFLWSLATVCIISHHICISTGCSTVHVQYTHIHIITCTHIISYTLPFDVTFYLTCLFPGSCGFAFADSSPRSFGTGKGASSDVYLEPLCPLFWIEPLKSRYACQYCRFEY